MVKCFSLRIKKIDVAITIIVTKMILIFVLRTSKLYQLYIKNNFYPFFFFLFKFKTIRVSQKHDFEHEQHLLAITERFEGI